MSYLTTIAKVYKQVEFEMGCLIEEAETVDDAKTKVEKAISLIKTCADLKIRGRELDEELLTFENKVTQEDKNNGI